MRRRGCGSQRFRRRDLRSEGFLISRKVFSSNDCERRFSITSFRYRQLLRRQMAEQLDIRGTFTFPNTSISVKRMGYGAMQLAGGDGDKMVRGPPRDVAGAIAVLREAVAAGVNHIDTSDFYGPHVTNQLIKQALYPYPEELVI